MFRGAPSCSIVIL